MQSSYFIALLKKMQGFGAKITSKTGNKKQKTGAFLDIYESNGGYL